MNTVWEFLWYYLAILAFFSLLCASVFLVWRILRYCRMRFPVFLSFLRESRELNAKIRIMSNRFKFRDEARKLRLKPLRPFPTRPSNSDRQPRRVIITPPPAPAPCSSDAERENDGSEAERRLDSQLRRFLRAPYYRVLHDVYLPCDPPLLTTQIDHIVLSKWRVFVIETKDWGGLIKGKVDEASWTVCYPDKSRGYYDNPIRQNDYHISVLAKCLNRPISDFQSIVAFTNRCRYDATYPDFVMGTISVCDYIKRHSVGEFVAPDVLPIVEDVILTTEKSIPPAIIAGHAERCKRARLRQNRRG